MTHAELIESLGGQAALSVALKIENSAVVGNWNKRGIPWKYRLRIADLARKADVELPQGFLDPTEQQASPQAA